MHWELWYRAWGSTSAKSVINKGVWDKMFLWEPYPYPHMHTICMISTHCRNEGSEASQQTITCFMLGMPIPHFHFDMPRECSRSTELF